MGTRLEWTTGSNGLRPGIREASRYTCPPSLHRVALTIAAASPVVATMLVLCVALLVA